MEYLIFGVIAVPCALLALFIMALATGAIADPDDLHQTAAAWNQSWKSLVHRL